MNKLHIIMYHYTRDLKNSYYPKINGLDINLFRQQIQYLKENFTIVSMEQVIDCVERKIKLPKNAALLTFDDGYIDNYLYALPILKSEKLQGSFFIPTCIFSESKLLDVNKIHYTLASGEIKNIVNDLKEKMDFYRGIEFDFLPTEYLFEKYAVSNRYDCKETIFVKRMLQTILPEKVRNKISSDLFAMYVGIEEEKFANELYLSVEQIRKLKRQGMFIGVHGHEHHWLGNLSEEECKDDIKKSLLYLDEFIDLRKWVMCYPYGSYNQNVLKFIENNGAILGLTTNVDVANLLQHNKFELPRLDCNDFPPKSYNYLNIGGE